LTEDLYYAETSFNVNLFSEILNKEPVFKAPIQLSAIKDKKANLKQELNLSW